MVNIAYIICSVLSFIPALVLHEVAHGFAAYKLGDPTAKASGRLSLNPLKHIDPFGTVILPAMLMFMGWPVFGYAKPVPYNPRYFKDPRRDDVIVGLAGPAANLAMAAIAAAVAWGCSGLVANPAFANSELFACCPSRRWTAPPSSPSFCRRSTCRSTTRSSSMPSRSS